MVASRLQVQGFLSKLNSIEPKTIFLAKQEKTMAFRALIDYDREDVIRELKQLAVENYSYGPNPNDWGDGTVWHFGLEVPQFDGEEKVMTTHRVYIKLCLVIDRNGMAITCMSFHPPAWRMEFPLTRPKIIWT